jgi:hypothetical protein
VKLHPYNPDRVLVSFALAFYEDCGHWGHKGAPGIDSHPGDLEYFYYTMKKDPSCNMGWRLHAFKTVAHSGKIQRREINEKILDSCEGPDKIVLSVGKHAVYVSWGECAMRTPAEVCLDGFSAGFRLYNIGTKPGEGPDLALLMAQGGQSNEKDDIWDTDGDGKFCGGLIKNRSKCVSAPGRRLSEPETGNQWELPCPGVGCDHNCPYGMDYHAGLCYEPCRSGYSGFVTMCIPGCPPKFRDDGLYCFKPKPYGRGAGFPWKLKDGFSDKGMFRRCEARHGKGNCEKWGAIVYPKCRESFHNVACCVCSPDCPPNTTDIGISCQKHTYDRGIGVIP